MPNRIAGPRSNRALLATSVSALALCCAGSAAAQTPLSLRRAPDAGAVAARAAQIQMQQSQRATTLAQASATLLQRAMTATAAMNQLQEDARRAALGQAAPGVPNGLQVGGLVPRVTADSWINAEAPTQAAVGGRTEVTVVQTAQRAILTWDRFNIGRETDLRFDQSRGGADARQWSVLNRIEDPSLEPSRILGSIRAVGQVAVVNRNGVIFTGSAQVETATFTASALDVGTWGETTAQRNARFLAGQLLVDSQGTDLASFTMDAAGLARLAAGGGQPTATVEVQAGARLASSGTEGTVLLAAPRVVNAGTLVSPRGQVILSAGAGLFLQAPTDETRAAATSFYPAIGNRVEALRRSAAERDGVFDTVRSEVRNEGTISAPGGNVTLAGFEVVNAAGAVISATTANNRPGSIFLGARDLAGGNPSFTGNPFVGIGLGPPAGSFRMGRVTLGPGSLLEIAGETGSDQVVLDGGAAFQQSRIVVNGAFVVLERGATIRAPAADLRIAGDLRPATNLELQPERPPSILNGLSGRLQAFLMEDGAAIDVGGVKGIEIPVARNYLEIDVRNNILQNAPLQRDGFLIGLSRARRSIVVDARLGSAVLDVTPFVNGVERSVTERQASGGAISIEADDILLLAGSRIDVSGGWINWQSGFRPAETRLLGSDGRLYTFSRAPADITFIGVAGESTRTQPRWGISELFLNPLLAGRAVFEAGYLEGFDAGAVTLVGRPVLDGVIEGWAQLGSRQTRDARSNDGNRLTSTDLAAGGRFTVRARELAAGTQGPAPSAVVNPTVVAQIDAPLAGNLLTQIDTSELVGDVRNNPAANDVAVRLAADPVQSTPRLRVDQAFPAARFDTLLPIENVLGRGFTSITIAGQGLFSMAAGLRLELPAQPSSGSSGPRFAVTAGQGVVDGQIIAPAGTILFDIRAGAAIPNAPFTLFGPTPNYVPLFTPPPADASEGSLLIGASAVLSVAGRWVNDAQAVQVGAAQDGPYLINGGTIDLRTGATGSPTRPQQAEVDPSVPGVIGREIRVRSGAVLDVSGGGFVSAGGALTPGAGGVLRLRTYVGATGVAIGPYARPEIEDGARLLGFGVGLAGRGAGNSSGGRLDLQAVQMVLGRSASAAEEAAGVLTVDLDRFAEAGFADFRLSTFGAVVPSGVVPFTGTDAGDIEIAAGARIAPVARSRVVSPTYRTTPTGAAGDVFGAPALLEQIDRPATRLWFIAANQLLLGDAATVLFADPGGIRRGSDEAIRLESPRPMYVAGTIEAPAGSIAIVGSGSPDPYFVSGSIQRDSGGNIFTAGVELVGTEFELARQPALWIAVSARISATGLAQTAVDVRTGLGAGVARPGGTVSLTENRGFLVVEAGAVVDVSGATGRTTRLAGAGVLGLPGAGLTAVDLPGDAGTISVVGKRGAFLDGSFRGFAGGTGAAGGTLDLTNPSNSGFIPIQFPNDPYSVPFLLNGSPVRQALILRQSGRTLPDGARFDGVIDPTLAFSPSPIPEEPPISRSDFLDRTIVNASLLDGSGLTRLILRTPTLYVQGQVTLNVPRVVQLSTGIISPTDLPPLAQGAVPTPGRLRLTSDYVLFDGQTIGSPTTTAPGTAAEIAARVIDIFAGLRFAGFETALLSSETDLRLTASTGAFSLSPTPQLLGNLTLASDGDLTLRARQIYPSTGTRATIEAFGPTDASFRAAVRRLRVERSAAVAETALPLSAGAELILRSDATEHFGTLRAPQGRVALQQVTPASPNPLSRIVFGGGSVTSVSLDGRILPYGETRGGPSPFGFELVPSAFYANFNLGNAGLTAPPEKTIEVNAANLTVEDGARLQLAGGGELIAYRFVPGPFGLRDVLARQALPPGGSALAADALAASAPFLFADRRDVFAILPGAQPVNAPQSPFIVDSGTSLGRGDVTANPLRATASGWVGDSITVPDGVPGLPGGTYTLLPARYALVPGAFRVVVPPAATTVGLVRELAGPVQSPEGTITVSAQRTSGLAGAAEAQLRLVQLQPEAVWRQFSDIIVDGVSGFFAQRAARAGTPVPRLPIDAGRLSLAATATLSLAGGTTDFARVPGGRGGLVEIRADRIAVTPEGVPYGVPGFLSISDRALSSLGAESLTLGAARTLSLPEEPVAGTRLAEVGASSAVRVTTGSVLSAPEVVLVAAGTGPEDGIRIEDGARVEASGELSPGSVVTLLLGRAPGPILFGGPQFPALPGGGTAVLRVAAGPPVPVVRANTPFGAAAGISLSDGATLGGASLLIDALGPTRIAPGTTFQVGALDLAAAAIRLGDPAPDAGLGVKLGAAQLAQLGAAADLTLRSRGGIGVFGPGTVRVSAGRTVTLDTAAIDGTGDVRFEIAAGESVQIRNSFGATTAPVGSGNGVLEAVAGSRLGFGGGATRLSGFGTARFATAGAAVLEGTVATAVGVPGPGALSTSGSLEIAAALVTATPGTDFALTVGGDLLLSGPAPGPTPALPQAPIGGRLIAEANAITVGTAVRIHGGTVDLTARTGSVVFRPTAVVDLSGLSRQFFDVVRHAPGGLLRVTAQAGSIQLQPGATLDVSAARPDLALEGLADLGSDAGAIALVAQQGAVGFEGAVLRGLAGAAARGGEFTLDAREAVSLPVLNRTLDAGGFAGGRLVHTRVGDLVVEAGQRMAAAEVVLVADGGVVRVDAGGTIDAGGAKGGRIELFGGLGVTVAGTLTAVASAAGERGGTVTIGTAGAGTLALDGATIDVGGFQPLYGSLVRFRLPVGQVNASRFGATVTGARRIEIEPYATRTVTDGVLSQALVNDVWGQVTAAVGGVSFAGAPAGAAITPGVEIVSAGNLTLGSGTTDVPLQLQGFRTAAGEAGVLTVRAGGTLTLLSSISDGFDRVDNPATPTDERNALNLWALREDRSFSIRLVGGAELTSANPLATREDVRRSASGDVLIGLEYGGGAVNPRLVRTGTGSIEIAAGRSVRLRDPDSVVYTAGRSIADPTVVEGFDAEGNPITGTFLLPLNPTYVANVVTAPPAYPASYLEGGGDLRVTAREDILADVTRVFQGTLQNAGEIVTAWLWRQGAVAQDDRTYLYREGSSTRRILGTGVACTSGALCLPAVGPSSTQSTWFIRLDQFNQNWGVLGGGDADFRAGQDFQGSISVPTTMRTGGGLRATYRTGDGQILPTPIGTGPRVRAVDGGGDLRVDVGRDIRPLSQFHLGRGTGVLRVGDDVEQGLVAGAGGVRASVGTLFSVSDAQVTLIVGGSATFGAYDPLQRRATRLQEGSDAWAAGGSSAVSQFSSYSSASLLAVAALAGEVRVADAIVPFETGRRLGALLPSSSGPLSLVNVSRRTDNTGGVPTLPLSGDMQLPVTSSMLTYNFDIQIPVLSTAADPGTSISILSGRSLRDPTLRGRDIDPSVLATPDTPFYGIPLINQGSTGSRPEFSPDAVSYFPRPNSTLGDYRDANLLFRSTVPQRAPDAPISRLYALTGDISAARIEPFIGTIGIHAGRDILDLSLRLQHQHPSDVSFAWADRDISTAPGRRADDGIGNTVIVAGPGRVQLIAGRDLGAIRTPSGIADFFPSAFSPGLEPFLPIGIRTTGNLPAPFLSTTNLTAPIAQIQNPNLSDRGGASIDILFGIGNQGGFDARGFLDRYLDPGRAQAGDIIYRVQEVRDANGAVTFAVQPAAPSGTSAETLARIRGLDPARQLALAIDLYFRELDASGLEANRPGPTLNSYARGYAAEATLFPFRGTYGGNFNLQGSFVRTENGGDINVLGPGGDFFLGAVGTVADSNPSRIGVLTLDYGAINIYAFGDIQVGQARVQTVNGGIIFGWSSTRDINAGRGARTARFIPPFVVIYERDLYREGNAAGLVTGSGFASLSPFTLPEDVLRLQDEPQNEAQAFAIAEEREARRRPRINLVAPIGAIDFGDAGVRSAGNLNVAALVVRNAEAAAAAGSTTGVPQVQVPNVAAAVAASAAAGSSQQAGTDAARRQLDNRPQDRGRPSTVLVEVVGFGATAEAAAASAR